MTSETTSGGDDGFHQWWPNRRRSGVEIYAVTVFSHRLFQNPLLLAIILTKFDAMGKCMTVVCLQGHFGPVVVGRDLAEF